MVIKHNIKAMNAKRNLTNNQNAVAGSLEKLSSGYKINRAADDAAGLAISEKMRSTITGLKQGTENGEHGVNLLRVADGAIQEIHEMCNRLIELSVQSANGTYEESDRAALQMEVDEIVLDIDRIVESTNYNGITLLNRDAIDTIIEEKTRFLQRISDTYTPIDVFTTGTVESVSGVISASNYKSEAVTVPSEALSVPSNAELPYVIEMNICVYDDVNSTETNALFTNKTVSVTVDRDNSGNLSVMGSNGVNYATLTYTNDADMAYDHSGSKLIQGDSNSLVTAEELQIIMEGLLSGSTYGISMGGDLGDYYSSYYYSLTDEGKIALGLPTATTNGSPNWSTVEATYYDDCISYQLLEEAGYIPVKGIVDNSYSSYYKNGMYFGQGYSTSVSTDSNQGRVIGVEIAVTSGGTEIASSETPSGFDHDQWTSSTDMIGLSSGSILGSQSVAEPYHTDVKLDDTFYTSAQVAAMTDEERASLILSSEKVISETYTDGELTETVIETGNFVMVVKPILEAVIEAYGPDVNIVWLEEDDSEWQWIESLCDTMESVLNVSVNRKLDSYNDVFLDDSEIASNRYVIQVGTFTQYDYYYETYEEITEVHDPIIIQLGAQNEDFDRVFIYIDNMQDEVVRLDGIDISSLTGAQSAIDVINGVINDASLNRAGIGAYENRLYHGMNANRITTENLQSAESTIRDTDFAEEMMKFTANNILVQASQAMLAQANTLPEGVLQLLG